MEHDNIIDTVCTPRLYSSHPESVRSFMKIKLKKTIESILETFIF